MNIFLIGSKGIPARYGGFETFVENLIKKKNDNTIRYHVACIKNSTKDPKEFTYCGARCFNIAVPKFGSAKAVLYDIYSLKASIDYIEKNNIKNSIIYILACRIGPFLCLFKKRIKQLNIKVYVNPDGHEWMRDKWNRLIKLYWKYSERLMIKYSDLIICDSLVIENYIKNEYKKYIPMTKFIAYGADLNESITYEPSSFEKWSNRNHVMENEYYLIVGRFVPENNYELIIGEYMVSNTKKDLVIITNIEHNKSFLKELAKKTDFQRDKRIKFVGTVYDQFLLKKIRENAFAYIHGHEVGGTNPSLLEAMASTKINILLNIAFNQEVGQNATLYFEKYRGSLASIIHQVELFSSEQIKDYETKSKQRIAENYSWSKITIDYENLFLKNLKDMVNGNEKRFN
jgi:rhamnosyltransferase